MKQTLISLLLIAVLPTLALAQVGIGTNNPDPNAALDMSASQKGLLLPRLTTAQQTTLFGSLGPAQTGMMVTDAASGKTIYWNGTGWKDHSNLATPITANAPLTISSTNIVSLNPGTAAGDLLTWDGNNWVNTQPANQPFTVNVSNIQPYLTLNYCIALVGIFPSPNEPFLSEIDLFSFAFPPKGFALCNGQILPINQNQALFSLMGTTYGGNGVNNFQLPNLQGRVPVHFGQGAGLSPYALGDVNGVETNTISK
ncbi:phage tail protein [Flavitalea flava]